MYSKSLATAAALVSAFSVATAQTFTDCNPLDKTCPSDPALGVTLNTDFTKGKSSDWVYEAGTTLSYDSTGAMFSISSVSQAPTIYLEPYILFGKITVSLKAAPGQGIVSSFILQSDDLDEIDWEWLGGNNAQVESNFFGKGNTTTYDRAIYHNVATPIDTFHTYTIDWTQDYIKWSIDGNLLRTLNYGDSVAVYGKNFPQTPMRVKMGNWVGCASVAAETDPKTQGTCQWAGGAVSFPGNYVMTVANVQVENYNCAQSYTYGDNSGSWQSIQKSGACGSPVNSTSSGTNTNSTSSVTSSASTTGGSTLSTSTTVSTVKPTGTATTTTGSPAKTSSTTSTSSAPAQQSKSAGEALKFSTANVAVAAGIVGLGFLML